MSQSIACRYRPQTFEEMLGQSSTIKILKRQLETGHLSHCYLFAGSSGCGKTTTARAFAMQINGGKGTPIEIDAASNNGVDAVRAIVDSAKERSVDSEFKIFIIDECFEGDSLVKTKSGYKKIKDIKIGESVATLTGYSKVTNVFENWVENNALNYLNLSNGKRILCTKDHLFLTTSGWIACKDLKEGDEVIVYSNLSKLWEENSNISKGPEVLLQQMPARLEKEEYWSKTCNTESLSNLWKNICSLEAIRSEENLFSGMSRKVNIAITKDSTELRVWDGHKEISFRKNVEKQSHEKTEKHSKDEAHKSIAWNTPSSVQSAWREWSLYETTADVTREFARFLNFRISDKNELLRIQSESISCSIQSRPWLSRENVSDRGGWQFASLEKEYCSRYQKREMPERVRVNSVEIYKSTDRAKSGLSHSGYTKVYDLSVDTCPTYFVNDVLVHNCHAISTPGWQAFLKCIEEPPAYTIFMFCTTNPEKVPETIQNRVMRLNISKVDTKLIANRLKYICEQEGYRNYDEACDYLAKLGNGGVRDSISYLEKCANYDPDLSIDNVLACLGNFSYDSFFNLTGALLNQDEGEVLNMIEQYYNSGNDLKMFIENYLEFTIDLAKYCIFKSMSMVKIPSSLENRCAGYAGIPDILDYTNKLVDKILNIKNAIKQDINPKNTVEVMFINICRGI